MNKKRKPQKSQENVAKQWGGHGSGSLPEYPCCLRPSGPPRRGSSGSCSCLRLVCDPVLALYCTCSAPYPTLPQVLLHQSPAEASVGLVESKAQHAAQRRYSCLVASPGYGYAVPAWPVPANEPTRENTSHTESASPTSQGTWYVVTLTRPDTSDCEGPFGAAWDLPPRCNPPC